MFQPRWAPGLAITVDYFDISIDDTITTFQGPNTWTACYANNDPAACARINRNPNGQFWVGNGFVQDLNINIGSLATSGYDVNIGYTGVEIGRFGSLRFNLTGTYLIDLSRSRLRALTCIRTRTSHATRTTASASTRRSASAEPAVATPVPRRAGRRRGTSTCRSLASLQRRHRPHRPEQPDAGRPARRELPAENYFDLAANWAITEKASVSLGINNVLDDNPSISGAVGNVGNGNTYPQIYDALGRYVFLRATVDF